MHKGEYELDIDSMDREEKVRRLLDEPGLTKQEKHALWLTYFKDASEAEVATALQVSPGRIHQVIAKALRKLRHPSRSEPLRPFVEEAEDNK